MGEVGASVGEVAGEYVGVDEDVGEHVDVDDEEERVNGVRRVAACQAADHLDSLEGVRYLKAILMFIGRRNRLQTRTLTSKWQMPILLNRHMTVHIACHRI